MLRSTPSLHANNLLPGLLPPVLLQLLAAAVRVSAGTTPSSGTRPTVRESVFLASFGKLALRQVGGSPAGVFPPSRTSTPDSLLYLQDRLSSRRFLVDTGLPVQFFLTRVQPLLLDRYWLRRTGTPSRAEYPDIMGPGSVTFSPSMVWSTTSSQLVNLFSRRPAVWTQRSMRRPSWSLTRWRRWALSAGLTAHGRALYTWFPSLMVRGVLAAIFDASTMQRFLTSIQSPTFAISQTDWLVPTCFLSLIW